ncbi:MAG: gamma carbonic anhydrase family protein [Acidobacteria bacterium]|nr:gamma carbonic anhydrase family protein [Acidobacteriota bacterium]
MHLELEHLTHNPQIPDSCYVDRSARINGDVRLGEHCSVWFNVSIRGDVHEIRVGERTNIQDNCIFHTSYKEHSLHIGDDVTFGHGVIAHGCTIGNRVLIGMGSIVMDGAVIADDVIIGAGSLVTEGKQIPSGMLALGRPAKVVRPLTESERALLVERAQHYMAYADAYRRVGKFTRWQDHPFK